MLANVTKHSSVVTRSISRALISSTPVSGQEYRFYDVPVKRQFRLELNSGYAYVEYLKDGDDYDLLHTQVPEEFEGQGIGKIIAEKTFDHIKTTDARMRVTCEYLQHVFDKYGDKYKHLKID